AVSCNELPEPISPRPVGCPFVHHYGGPQREGSVYHVGMACYPTDIGRAPEDVLLFEIEDILRRAGHLREIASRGVNDALGLARGTGRIEDEQHIFGIHCLGRTVRQFAVEQLVPPVVTPPSHVDVRSRRLLRRGGARLDRRMLKGAVPTGFARAEER